MDRLPEIPPTQRLCENSKECHPRTVNGIATLRRSVLSIACGQWRDRDSVGVTCSRGPSRARQADRSLLRSDGIAGHRVAIKRSLLRSGGAHLGKGRQPLCRLSMNDAPTIRGWDSRRFSHSLAVGGIRDGHSALHYDRGFPDALSIAFIESRAKRFCSNRVTGYPIFASK